MTSDVVKKVRSSKNYIYSRTTPIECARMFELDNDEDVNMLLKSHRLQVRRWRKIKNQVA